MAALIVVLLFVFLRYAHQVQVQAELAAIKSTVGSLRTALVVDHLQRQVAATRGAGLPVNPAANPFELVSQKPLGYVGELDQVQAATAPPGSWFFAIDCGCIGYRPMDDASLNSPASDPVIWYLVTGYPGVLQLTPKDRYRWNKEMLE